MVKPEGSQPDSSPHIVAAKTTAQIAREWDQVAVRRAGDIESGIDVSYISVLTPTVLDMLPSGIESAKVLDVGCGTGALGRTVAPLVNSLVGVDPSARSIEIARTQAQERGVLNVDWVAADIEGYATDNRLEYPLFDVAIANMTLMDTVDLKATLAATASLCRAGAKLVWTITHPCFWPLYWGYYKEEWFNYKEELWIEAEFKTAMSRSGSNTTHIHRPLEMYMDTFACAGFELVELREPMPLPDGAAQNWRYPRFLAGSCILREDSLGRDLTTRTVIR